MLEYTKLILQKVSFDSGLFEKELKKSLYYLKPEEMGELFSWLKAHHAEYGDMLNTIQQWFVK